MPQRMSSLSPYRLSPLLWGVVLVFLVGMWTCGNASGVFNRLERGAGEVATAFSADDIVPEAPPKAEAPTSGEFHWALGSRGGMEPVFAAMERAPDHPGKHQTFSKTAFAPDKGALTPQSGISSPGTLLPKFPVRAVSWHLPAARGLVRFSIPPPSGLLG